MKETDIEVLKSELKTKGNDDELQDLISRFNIFQDVENIYNFKNIYLPRMKKFFDSVDDLLQSNADMREIIIDFDKKLSLKLNKSSLATLQQDMGTNFLPHEFKEEVMNKFYILEAILDKNTDLCESVADECREKVTDLVTDAMESLLKNKFEKYDSVAQSF